MMNRYKITILVESDEDPSAILDNVTHAVEEGYINVDLRLDPQAESDGTAVEVEEL
jgi:hypothetical protein